MTNNSEKELLEKQGLWEMCSMGTEGTESEGREMPRGIFELAY